MTRELLKPEPFECPLPEGGTKTFILSKFPAVAGREIIAKYPLSGMPKVGEYAVNEETMLKLMNYVAIERDGDHIRLSTRELIDNHCTSWEVLARLEYEMLKRNCSFFADGRASTFLAGIAQKGLGSIIETLTASLPQLLKAAERALKN